MKSLVLVVALTVPIVVAVGQNAVAGRKRAAAAQPKAPTPAEVDAVLKRVHGYDSSIQWKIFLVRRSAVPGMNEVLLQLKGEFHHLFLTADGHFAIDGDMLPFALIHTRACESA